MSKKDAKNIISSYRKKQKRGPYIIGGIAILLAIAGIVLLIIYLVGGGNGMQISLFSSKTPTPTETATPTPVTPTSTATNTATITNTPTQTQTSTPSAPFEYQVQEGDNCTTIAEQFEVEVEVLLALNNLTSGCFITVGQTILIPAPGGGGINNSQQRRRCPRISDLELRLNIGLDQGTVFSAWQMNLTPRLKPLLKQPTNTGRKTIWKKLKITTTSL